MMQWKRGIFVQIANDLHVVSLTRLKFYDHGNKPAIKQEVIGCDLPMNAHMQPKNMSKTCKFGIAVSLKVSDGISLALQIA